MARKRAEKVGFKDIVTLAKSGWTPDEVNELLDRMEAMGDLNAPPTPDNTDDDLDDVDEDNEEPGGDDNPEEEDDEDDQDDLDDENEDIDENLTKLKKTALEVENERLKKDIKKLQAINKNKDVSISKKYFFITFC